MAETSAPERDTGEPLLELAERCEQATGPDRELDGAIANLLDAQDGWALQKRANWPRYTASLDAAMTLVPEGWEGRGEWRFSKGMRPAYASLWKTGASDIHFHANATGQTVALALTAAALRARAADRNTQDEKGLGG